MYDEDVKNVCVWGLFYSLHTYTHNAAAEVCASSKPIHPSIKEITINIRLFGELPHGVLSLTKVLGHISMPLEPIWIQFRSVSYIFVISQHLSNNFQFFPHYSQHFIKC